MNNTSASCQLDFYKTGHVDQYVRGVEEVESNWTARSNAHATAVEGKKPEGVIFFGLQAFILDYLIEEWNTTFFQATNKKEAVKQYWEEVSLGLNNPNITTGHLEDLYELGYIPLEILALPEGAEIPIGVPMFTVRNTDTRFGWLTNYIESVLSAEVWKPMTVATIAKQYKDLITKYCELTGGIKELLPFQCHDFSFRGMSGRADAARSGMGHLLSFAGTDNVPAIIETRKYYQSVGFVGGSIPATEHSVMSLGEKDKEIATFHRLITEVYPAGIVSIVSDTWDFWKVLTEYAPALRKEIEARDGKVVFRPDSGDPVKIICGDPQAGVGSPAYKGAIQVLWEEFGGTINDAGYKELNPKVGLIYGDSITLDRASEILSQLMALGFASTNIVFGIGSFTYNYITRDTFGMAMKATHGIVKGKGRDIFKDPITDDGTKKSLRGKVRVEIRDGEYVAIDGKDYYKNPLTNELRRVFLNGSTFNTSTWEEVKQRIV